MVSAGPTFSGYVPRLFVTHGRWWRMELGELRGLRVTAALAVRAAVAPSRSPNGPSAPYIELGLHSEVEFTDVLSPQGM